MCRAFFITNLFLGVLIDFIGQSDGSAFQTEAQQQWADLQRNIGNAKPPTETLKDPDDLFRRLCAKVISTTCSCIARLFGSRGYEHLAQSC